jgi:hypothetical protein
MLADTGWSVDASRCSTSLPVEYAGFDAMVDGEVVRLTWRVEAEVQNAGFNVEMRVHDSEFRRLGFVPSDPLGPRFYRFDVPSLLPGRYQFRLQHVAMDGSVAYGPTVEAAIEASSAFVLTGAYPNPFNPETRFSLAVRKSQPVRVDVFDALGRHVVNLYDGPMVANQAVEFTLEGQSLPGGLYIYRATGRDFAASRKVLLLK